MIEFKCSKERLPGKFINTICARMRKTYPIFALQYIKLQKPLQCNRLPENRRCASWTFWKAFLWILLKLDFIILLLRYFVGFEVHNLMPSFYLLDVERCYDTTLNLKTPALETSGDWSEETWVVRAAFTLNVNVLSAWHFLSDNFRFTWQ